MVERSVEGTFMTGNTPHTPSAGLDTQIQGMVIMLFLPSTLQDVRVVHTTDTELTTSFKTVWPTLNGALNIRGTPNQCQEEAFH